MRLPGRNKQSHLPSSGAGPRAMGSLPRDSTSWREEIIAAYEDAREALPFMPVVGVAPRKGQLFHLAPHVAIKFRGLPESRREAAVQAALTSIVASQEHAGSALADAFLAFAFSYLASHFGLNLVSQATVEHVMEFLENGHGYQAQ